MPTEPAALVFRPIGVIHSPHRDARGTPIQPAYAQGSEGRVVLEPEYADALFDLHGFERIWLIYQFDRAQAFRARVVPYRDDREHGLFATRAPCRPNPVGMSVVRLLRCEEHTLHVAELDVLDGTPLIDIKPYIPEFDAYPDSRAGWFDAGRTARSVADLRFHGPERS